MAYKDEKRPDDSGECGGGLDAAESGRAAVGRRYAIGKGGICMEIGRCDT